MRKAINQFRNLLLDFIEQRDDLMLVVACPPSEAALLLKLLLDEEKAQVRDIYYLTADDFASGPPYVDALVARLKRDYEASLQSTDSGDDPLPPLPDECLSSATPAAVRLKAAFGYTRGLLPISTGHRVIWAMSPSTIDDLNAYVALMQNCVPRPAIEPWMRGSRLIVRVPESFPDNAPLVKSPRVRFRRFAIAADAGEMELKETVQDASQPDAERMRALLQLSFIDVAYSRHTEAIAGLRAALAWYQKTGDLALQAVAMIGLGDCCRRAGDIEKAKSWYECAIEPAGAAKQMMPLSLIAQHLGAIAYSRKQYEDAVAYYEQLVIVKRAMTDEDGLVEALLWRGRAQEKVGLAELALVSWEEAMLVSRVFELGHREAECLEQMRKGFAAQGRAASADRVAKEWTLPPSGLDQFAAPAFAS